MLRSVLDGLDAAVYVADMKTHELLFTNEYLRKVFGDAEGKICWETLQADQSGPCSFCTNEKLLTPEGKPTGVCSWEFQNTVTGRWYDIRDRAIPWIDGRMVRLEIATDITDRKKSEERLKLFSAAVEEALDAIQIVGLDGRIIYSNKAVEKIYGFTPEEYSGRNVNEMNADPEFAGKVILPAIKKEGYWAGELDVKHKDGRVFPIWLSTSLVKDLEGKPIAMLGVIRDMTERKKSEKDLKDYAKKLEETNQLKALFADIMKHDLINPMGIILGATESLLLDIPDSRELLMIRRSSERVVEIIENANTMSRLESAVELEKKKLDLKDVIDSVIDDNKSLLESAGLDVENKVKTRMPVLANPVIREAFFNLLSNAAKYASEGKRVVIDLMDQGKSYRLMFKDYGPGVPDEHKEGIFNRFRTRQKMGVKGSGLGLTITKRIVDLHGGRIWVEDNPEGGCIIYIDLPKS